MSKKDYYVKEISKRSNKGGNKLLEMIDHYGVFGIRELSEEQVKDYYERYVK